MEMPGDVIAALKLVPEKVINDMWDALIVEKALQIEGRSGMDLPDLKAEIKQLRETKNWFQQERHRK